MESLLEGDVGHERRTDGVRRNNSIDISHSINKDQVAVVIPAFNEEVTIGSVVLNSLKYCSEVYVVNDGSIDMTSQVAELAGALVLDMEHNSGKAAALMKGLRAAKRDGYRVSS